MVRGGKEKKMDQQDGGSQGQKEGCVCARAHAHMLTHVHVHRGTQVCKNIEFKAITL